ncbi:PDZ domain-containing protein [Pseudomonas sp. NPDC007930]|uniref:PDZ domain-containing protein n=1 Tax=Pseudomonas sp. NPDC007930 TaxID=3364417 RepID=UPI0036E793C8
MLDKYRTLGCRLALAAALLGLHGCADPIDLMMYGLQAASDTTPATEVAYPVDSASLAQYQNAGCDQLQQFYQVYQKPDYVVTMANHSAAIVNIARQKGCPSLNGTPASPAPAAIAAAAPSAPATVVAPPSADRGFGIEVETLSSTMATAVGLSPAQGVLVIAAPKGGAGDKGGLKALDVITEVSGQAVTDTASLQAVVGSMRTGYKATVRVWRAHAFKDLTVVVSAERAAVAATAPAPASAPAPAAVSADSHGWLGLNLEEEDAPLPPPLARDLGMPAAQGVLVMGVSAHGAAEQAKMQAGDIVQSVDGQAFNSPTALRAYLGTQPGGKTLQVVVWRNHRALALSPVLTANPPAVVPISQNYEVYCYVMVMGDGVNPQGYVRWLSKVFPVPAATRNTAYEMGNVVAEQFKQYLLAQGVSPASVTKSYGICANGTYNAFQSWKAELAARKLPAFTQSGGYGVTLLWEP